ncbi:MAG TPA: phage holin family protein [Actinomycetes bacterium]|nr:phage holin family protein [Actinomycetes bacterium]
MTATSPGHGPDSTEQTLGALFVNASRDLSALVRSEIELAKAEIRVDVKNGAAGGAMFGAAGFLGLLAVVLLSIAAAYGLVALGLHPGWAFLIVAGAYLLVAALLVLVGKRTISKVGPPERTIRTSKDTASFLKSPRSDGAAGAPTPQR